MPKLFFTNFLNISFAFQPYSLFIDNCLTFGGQNFLVFITIISTPINSVFHCCLRHFELDKTGETFWPPPNIFSYDDLVTIASGTTWFSHTTAYPVICNYHYHYKCISTCLLQWINDHESLSRNPLSPFLIRRDRVYEQRWNRSRSVCKVSAAQNRRCHHNMSRIISQSHFRQRSKAKQWWEVFRIGRRR